jgi:hypothetical protein
VEKRIQSLNSSSNKQLFINLLSLETSASSVHTFNCLASNESTLKIDPILEQSIEDDPFFMAPIHPNQMMPSNITNKY